MSRSLTITILTREPLSLLPEHDKAPGEERPGASSAAHRWGEGAGHSGSRKFRVSVGVGRPTSAPVNRSLYTALLDPQTLRDLREIERSGTLDDVTV